MLEEISRESTEWTQSEESQPSSDTGEHKAFLSTTHASSATSYNTDSVDSEVRSFDTSEEKRTVCSAETNCGVYNYKVRVSADALQRGAVVLSNQLLTKPQFPNVEDIVHQESPLRRMAVSITE